ncbi:MAG: LytR C-terminal domain-containing protein [Pseudomonadota bacterium]
MRTTIKYLSTVCAGAMLLACAGTGTGTGTGTGRQAAQVTPAPLPGAAAPPASADGNYILGRDAHAAGREDRAMQAYLQALRIDPSHINAGNGLAVLYAAQGDYARAITLWQGLTARAGAAKPAERALLLRNLGHAHFLSGANEAALAALEQACLLDPLNAVTWDHLAKVLEKTGQGERAAAMRKQAGNLRQHDVKADYALAGRIDGAVDPGAPSGDGAPAMARTEVVQSGALVQVRRVAAATPKAALQATLSSALRDLSQPAPLASADPARALAVPAVVPSRAAPAAAPLRLEIRNGNGVTGMAAALGRTLSGADMQVVNLANEKDFAVARTRVEYGPRQEAEARQLAARLGSQEVSRQVQSKAVDMRVILGHDLTDPVALHRRYMKQLRLARAQLAKLG